eukprot:UN24972
MNNILTYCQQLYREQPNGQSIKVIQDYLSDNVQTVGEHIFGVSRKIETLFSAQQKELHQLSVDMAQINHRLTSSEGFVSNAFMLKFRGLPRKPVPTIVKNQTLPPERIPRAAKAKRPWKRSRKIDYTILDALGKDGGEMSHSGSVSATPGPGYSNNRSVSSGAPPPRLSQRGGEGYPIRQPPQKASQYRNQSPPMMSQQQQVRTSQPQQSPQPGPPKMMSQQPGPPKMMSQQQQRPPQMSQQQAPPVPNQPPK